MLKRNNPSILEGITWVTLASVLLFAPGCGKDDGEEDPTPVHEHDAQTMPAMQAPLMDLSQANQKPTDVMVDVDGVKFTRGELDKRVMQVLLSQGVPPQMIESVRPQAEQQVLRAFVERTVLLSDAETRKIEVTEEELKKVVADLTEAIPPGQNLEALLERSGVTVEDFHTSVRDDIRIKKLIDVIAADVPKPSDEEVKAAYEENKDRMNVPESVHARHILIRIDEGADDAAKAEKKKTIDELRKKIADGADFAEVAAASSDCPSGKRGGGDLGTFGRGAMVKAFEDAAYQQKVGELGPVIETRFGYHIIEVLEHNKAEEKTLADVREDIVEGLQRQMKEKAARTYVDELKSKATVKYENDLAQEAPSQG